MIRSPRIEPARWGAARVGKGVRHVMDWLTGDWLIGELVALAGPAYFFLQILMAVRYRGSWRLAALAPLLVMVPLALHAGLAYAGGAPGWPLLLVLATPVAF